MGLSAYLTSTRDARTVDLMDKNDGTRMLLLPAEPIVCRDGFSISVQASEFSYCTPRTNKGPWSSVECGYPSDHPGAAMMEFADNRAQPTQTIYAYVPIKVVEALIEQHGGLAGCHSSSPLRSASPASPLRFK